MYYTGISIGPLYRAIKKAHKTREIWFASFWFSELARALIDEIIKDSKFSFISPYPEKKINISNPFGFSTQRAGVFPERIIISSQKSCLPQINKMVHKIVEEKSVEFNKVTGIKLDNKYLHQFLRIKVLELEYEPNNNSSEEFNIVFEMNKALANAELQDAYLPVDNELFRSFLHNVTKTKAYKNLFGLRFPSIIEIATNGLKHPDGMFNDPQSKDEYETSDDELWNNIFQVAKNEKSNNNENGHYYRKLKVPHKYIAIIEADGDNFGKIIDDIYKDNPAVIQDFSKAISEFSIEATRLIYEFGGFPVYAGGDDLLWFQPILIPTKDDPQRNFLDLISALDTLLVLIIKKYQSLHSIHQKLSQDQRKKPTLSYGVSIKYYKYPMHESRQEASLALKQIKHSKTKIKNKIKIRLEKHTGPLEVVLIDKNFNSELLTKILKNKDGLGFNGILYSLRKMTNIVVNLLSQGQELEPFFKNNFNEKIHAEQESFITEVSRLVKQIFEFYKPESNNNKSSEIIKKETKKAALLAIQNAKSYLYFSKFLNQEIDV